MRLEEADISTRRLFPQPRFSDETNLRHPIFSVTSLSRIHVGNQRWMLLFQSTSMSSILGLHVVQIPLELKSVLLSMDSVETGMRGIELENLILGLEVAWKRVGLRPN